MAGDTQHAQLATAAEITQMLPLIGSRKPIATAVGHAELAMPKAATHAPVTVATPVMAAMHTFSPASAQTVPDKDSHMEKTIVSLTAMLHLRKTYCDGFRQPWLHSLGFHSLGFHFVDFRAYEHCKESSQICLQIDERKLRFLTDGHDVYCGRQRRSQHGIILGGSDLCPMETLIKRTSASSATSVVR